MHLWIVCMRVDLLRAFVGGFDTVFTPYDEHYVFQVYKEQDSQNFKIPGSPSGRYSSDFGSPKIYLTSPNKKNTFFFLNIEHQVGD